MQRRIDGFSASCRSYACAQSQFAEHSVLLGRAWVHASSVGRWSRVHGRLSHTHVGAFCSIAAQAVIGGLGRHPTDQVSSHSAFFGSPAHLHPQPTLACGPGHITTIPLTTIGNDVWIAYRAMVLHGLTIGDGAVIAAGSIVTHDVPPFAVVAGTPARIIRYRFEDPELRSALTESQWWHWTEAQLRHIATDFQADEPLTLRRWQVIAAQAIAAPGHTSQAGE